MFIALEGPDCAGKTTQAEKLVNRLRAFAGCEVLPITCPTGSPAGHAARACLKQGIDWKSIFNDPLLPETLIQSAMIADRYGVVGAIQECIRCGGVVVADRWKQSGEIYGAVDGLDVDWITASQSSLPDPDLNILLDLNVEEISSRLKSRGAAPEMYENIDFQRQVAKRYHDAWLPKMHDHPSSWKIVDAKQSIHSIHEQILKMVAYRYRGLIEPF
jgi:dTMP kinase